MRIILENRGYEVRNALDSSEGMERLREARPDLIILDVMMAMTPGCRLRSSSSKPPA